MKITHSQHEAAYQLGIQRHKGKIGIAEARRRLTELGLNPNSGSDLVYNVSHMLNGRSYARMLSVPVTDDFLSWIRRDYGDVALARAVDALGKHITYYEKLRSTRLPKLRAVKDKYLAMVNLTNAPQEPAILFEWRDRESRGYVDVLPMEMFTNLGHKLGVIHDVRSLDRKKGYKAKCNISVHPTFADLDYEAFGPFNTSNEMFLGIARLHFADTDRTSISSVEWKPKGKTKFTDQPFNSINFEQPPDPPYIPPTKSTNKKRAMVRERPGQTAFRRKLKAVYNDCCCFTGCDVSEALEGAHIDPYLSPASDNIRNGLLLRRDIHALFDANLIAIEPDTHVVVVARSAKTAYAEWHGRKLTPPKDVFHKPDTDALKRHWAKFKTAHPEDDNI